MSLSLVIVGSAGHVGYVLSDLAAYPQVRFTAYAPSYPEEDVARYGRPDADGTAPRGYDDWRAMLDAERPDIVVVAGKGHEATQTIGDVVVAFDDRVVVRELLEARS